MNATNIKEFNETFYHLAVDEPPADMQANVGKVIRYKIPTERLSREKFLRQHGTIALQDFEIVGIQKDYKGNLCYRVRHIGFGLDTFGRCVDPALVEIAE